MVYLRVTKSDDSSDPFSDLNDATMMMNKNWKLTNY